MFDIHAVARSEFRLQNFDVYESLLGKSHTFELNDTLIRIDIPSKTEIDHSNEDIEFSYQEEFSLGKNVGYDKEKGKRGNNIYMIRFAWATIAMSETFRIIESDLQDDGKHYRSFSNDQMSVVDRELNTCAAIARKGFQYWLRVVRWQTQSGLIGRTTGDHPDEHWRVTFCDISTGENLGFGIERITGKVVRPVTPSAWKNIQIALRKEKESPIWWELFFEGEVALANGDNRGATLYFAISIESYLREEFLLNFPKSMDPEILNIVQSQTGVRQIIERVVRNFFPEVTKSEWSTLHKLFDWRNKRAHEGSTKSVSDLECQKFRKIGRKLMSKT